MKMMNYIMFLLLLHFTYQLYPRAASTLQSKIDESPKGATIEIEEGEYEETLVISKPHHPRRKG